MNSGTRVVGKLVRRREGALLVREILLLGNVLIYCCVWFGCVDVPWRRKYDAVCKWFKEGMEYVSSLILDV